MGKNQNSVVVLRLRLKFWWMIDGGRERDSQVADPGFKIRQKWPENAFFWHLRVPIGSLERGIGKEADIHMMNNHLWSLSSGFYTQVVRPTTSLWVQNTAKSALKSTLFA